MLVLFFENVLLINFFNRLDSFLSQNVWKIHEEFGLMIDDINQDQQRRSQYHWQMNRAFNCHFCGRRSNSNSGDQRSFQRVSIANGIFVQNGYSLRPDYQEAILSVYKSTLQRLDFEKRSALSTEYINR